MTDDPKLRRRLAKLANEISDLQRQVHDIARASQGAYRSIEGGAQYVYDADGTLRTVIGQQPDGSYTVGDYNSPAPYTPSDPLIYVLQGMLQITWDGTNVEGYAWPSDFKHVEVHVSSTPSFTPTDATEVTVFPSTKGGSAAVALDHNIGWYVKLVAVNTAGVEGSSSTEVAGQPDPPVTSSNGITTYYTNVEPIGADTGDLWVDTDDANHLYRFNGTTWESVRDGTIAVAQADATQALLDAATAQSTADGKITTFYQTTQPASGMSTGDLWLDTDDGNKLYRYNGTTWELAQDTGIQAALTAAGDAQATADGKVVTFAQTTAPTATAVGDLWIDTDAGNKIYRWDGAAWQPFSIGLAALASEVTARSLGSITTYYQTTQPASGMVEGDLWLDTDDGNKLYRYNGSSWVVSQDTAIQAALTAAGDAQSTADGKVVTFAQATQPTAVSVGDLWIETDNGNKIWRWNGSAWVEFKIGVSGLAADVTARNLGSITTYYQATQPASGMLAGDLWMDTDDDNKLYRYSGSAWQLVQDAGITAALTAAGDAQATADGKIVTFAQATQPTATSIGDLWIETDNDNKLWRWNGSSWVAFVLGSAAVSIPTSDGSAPASSPTPVASGGIGALYVKWPGVANGDPVTYELHMSTNSGATITPGSATTLVSETPALGAVVRTEPDGTALVYNTEYFFWVVATDVDGNGPVSAVSNAAQLKQITTTDDVAANQAWFGTVNVDRLTGGTLEAEVITGLGRLTTRTNQTGAGVDLSSSGIQIFDSLGELKINFPSNLSDERPADFDGNVQTGSLLVRDGLTVRGGTNEFAREAVVVLSNKTTASTTPPVAVDEYTTTALSIEDDLGLASYQIIGFQWHSGDNQWEVAVLDNTFNTLYITRYNTDFTYNSTDYTLSAHPLDLDPIRVIRLGGTGSGLTNLIILYQDPLDLKYRLYAKYSPFATWDGSGTITPVVMEVHPGLSEDGTSVGLWEYDDANNRYQVRRYQYNQPSGTWTTLTTVYHAQTLNRPYVSNALYGYFDYDTPQWVTKCDLASNVYTFNFLASSSTTAGTLDTDYEFRHAGNGFLGWNGRTRAATLQISSASTSVTSSDANFTSADVGGHVYGTGIPTGTTITSVTSSTLATMSVAATASGTYADGKIDNGKNFYQCNGYGSITKFEGGTNNWFDGSSVTKTWKFAFTWKDNNYAGTGTYQTNLSTIGELTHKKRAKVRVTVPTFPQPSTVDPYDSVTHAGIYWTDSTDAIPVYTSWWHQGDIASDLAVGGGLNTSDDLLNWESNSLFSTYGSGTRTLDTVVMHAGAGSMKVEWAAPTGGATNSWVNHKSIYLTKGTTYTISAWVYVPTGNPDVSLEVGFYAAGSIISTKDSWVQTTLSFTAPESQGYFIGVRTRSTPTAGQIAYVDDFSVTQDNLTTGAVLSITEPRNSGNNAPNPATNTGFPDAQPAQVRSANNLLILKGDSSGQWGPHSYDSSGKFTDNQPHAKMTKSGQQSLGNNSGTQITFETAVVDSPAGFCDLANDVLVIPEDGDYLIHGQVRFASNGTGDRAVRVDINTSPLVGNSTKGLTSTWGNFVSVSVIAYGLVANDTIRMTAYQNSGASLDTSTDTSATYLAARKVSS